MSLTVLSIAFPFASVRPDGVGGAEQILSVLDHALVDAGHRSLVVACEGSQTAGRLYAFPAPKSNIINDTQKETCRDHVQAAIDRALASHPVDLVHMHGLDFYRYTLPPHVPVLVTLHLPIAWYPAEIWQHFAGRVQFFCVSHSQRHTCPPQLSNVVVIENGTELLPFAPAMPRENFALVLGRICPEKNQHAALEAGMLAKIPILLGGNVFPYPEHRAYFEEKIRPLLNREPVRHKFLGPLGTEQKHDLLRRAKCLLHPTLAPETSSLVAMEALAAGTPVIAYHSGALSEIIEHGITGFLVNDAQQMAEALLNVHTLSHSACCATAERRFNRDRMVREYLALYESLVRHKPCEAAYA